MKLLAAFLAGIAAYHIALHALYRWVFRQSGAREGALEEEGMFV